MKVFSLAIFALCFSLSALAQSATESFKVAGNCGMCKTRIEKAAKAAGAEEATWDKDSKMLTVKFSSSSTSLAKIQQKVAEVGHDNDAFKATNETYSKLPGCCKYERASSDLAEKMDCCKKDGDKMICSKEGHSGMDCCKKDGDHKMNCAKDAKDGAGCCDKKNKAGEKMNCAKEGADKAACCKKEQ